METHFKRYFITGLILLLPLLLTFIIVGFVINLLTKPFVGAVKSLIGNTGLIDQGFLFLSAERVQLLVSQALILLLIFGFILVLGVIARYFLVRSCIKLGDKLFHKIPVVRSVYKTSKDVIKTIFKTDTKSFKQVVLIPFPNKNTLGIGLVTKENIEEIGNIKKSHAVVFIPTTPNPTSGFVVVYPEEQIIHLDMKVEDALKYVISCGVITSSFNETKSPRDA